MINDDTIKLLRECNSGVKMGVISLDRVKAIKSLCIANYRPAVKGLTVLLLVTLGTARHPLIFAQTPQLNF